MTEIPSLKEEMLWPVNLEVMLWPEVTTGSDFTGTPELLHVYLEASPIVFNESCF